MSHKKSKNYQAKDQIAKLKNQAQLSDSACQLDHEHSDCNNEPFSIDENIRKNKIQQKKLSANSSKNELIDDVAKSFDNNLNFSSNVISNNMETSKAANNLLQEFLLSTSSYLSNALKENIEVSKDFLKCKDSNDLVNFQNNFFKVNFANILDYSIKISSLMQNFATDHVDIFNNSLHVNNKIVHNES